MPGTTNFLVFNPGQLNQESDTSYASDSTRTGGAGTGGIFPSPLANKLFYQVTTFVAAFGSMLANKGFSNSDASLPALTGVLSNLLTTADANSKLISLPFASTLTFNWQSVDGYEVVLSGNVVSSSSANMHVGQELTLILVQDATGSRTFATPTGFNGFGSIDPTPGSVNIQKFKVRTDGSAHASGPMSVS